MALILDVAGLAGLAGIDVAMQRREVIAHAGASKARAQSYIVFRAGDDAHCAVPLAMVARLEQVPRTRIERFAGSEVLQYRDTIMPIVRPERVLRIGADTTPSSDQPLIVFDFGHMVGMAVSGIIDVVDVEVDQIDVSGADLELTLGRVVVFGRESSGRMLGTVTVAALRIPRHCDSLSQCGESTQPRFAQRAMLGIASGSHWRHGLHSRRRLWFNVPVPLRQSVLAVVLVLLGVWLGHTFFPSTQPRPPGVDALEGRGEAVTSAPPSATTPSSEHREIRRPGQAQSERCA